MLKYKYLEQTELISLKKIKKSFKKHFVTAFK